MQGDGGEGLCGSFHVHTFFCLNSLVQTVAIASSLHDTSGLLIHDFHFTVFVHDVFIVAVKERVSLQQLCHGVHAFSLERIFLKQLVALSHLFFIGERFVGHGRELAGDVGEHEELRVFSASSEHVDTLVGEFHRIVLLFDNKVERVGNDVHISAIVLHILRLDFHHSLLHALFREELNKGLIFRQTLVGAIEAEHTFFEGFVVVAAHHALGIGEQLRNETALRIIHAFHIRLKVVEHLVFALGHRA